MNLTFGTPGLSKRHQSKLNLAADSISNLLEGKTQLPFNALDNAVKQATGAPHSAQTELVFKNDINTVDPSNPK
ncbi:hypothetical protein [Oceanobacillus sp. 1P07AA]|uniref:hypothetical protein n=1 Tax=Oceanobacillus sp. 1P07AA TaxID=3132293 RepID=UPI0039A62B76